MKPLWSKMSPQLLFACSILFFHVQAQMHQCLNSLECAPNKRCARLTIHRIDGECGQESCDYGPNRCVGKLGLFRRCSLSSGDCRPGLYCAFDVRGRKFLPVCAPKKKLGRPCSPTDTRPCESDPKVRCNRETKRCERFTGGRLNDKCTWFQDCRHEEGFYCNLASKKCAPRKPDGAKCEFANYECSGFCIEQKTPRGNKRVCTSQARLGQLCRGDSSCRGSIVDRRDVDDVRCNYKWHGRGVCVRRSKTLRKAGDVCDPKNDRCDRERNLYCRKAKKGHRCFQRSEEGGYCTPKSNYSSCNEREAGAPLECRRPLSRTKKRPYGVATCQRKPKTARRGEICNRKEFARCQRGTKCRVVAGIEAFDGEDPEPPLAYCLKLVKVGKNCRDRFKTGCVKGSYCIKGKCRKRKKPPRVYAKYAGDYVQCRGKRIKKRCARGLTCAKSGGWGKNRCVMKSVKILPGQACYDLPNKRPVCTTGYKCVRDLKKDGHKRCLKQGRLHDYCDFGTCAKGLKCRPRWSKSPLSELTCYNPKTALSAGKKCTISAKNRSHNCGLIKIDHSERPLKCVRVPGQNGSRKCMLVNQIFEYCNKKQNIVCASKLSCNRLNICVKRK